MTTKKFVAVAAVAFAFAFAFTASAYDLGSTTLKRGSKGPAVAELQKALNEKNGAALKADGSFGPGTESAVKAFQASKGLKADGLAGNGTKAALNASTNSSTTTTEALCPNGMTLASNCMTAPGVSTPVNVSGAPLSINSDQAVSGYYNTSVGVGALEKPIANLRLVTGAGGSATLTGLNVSFENKGSGDYQFTKYAASVGVWLNGVKVGTLPVSSFTDYNSVFSAYLPVTGGTLNANSTNNIVLSVSALPTIDSTNYSADNWAPKITSIRYQDGTGIFAYTPTASWTSTSFNFTSSASAMSTKLTVIKNVNDSNDKIVTGSSSANTNGVTVAMIDLNAQGDAIRLRKFPVNLQVAGGATITSAVVNTLRLYDATGTQLDSQPVIGTISSETVTFNNLNLTVAAGTTATLTVKADFNTVGSAGFAAGSSAQINVPSVTGIQAYDSGSNVLDASNSSVVTGSTTGSTVKMYVNGVSVVSYGTATTDVSPAGGAQSHSTVVYTIPFSVTAFGAVAYVPTVAAAAASASAAQAIQFCIDATTACAAAGTGIISYDGSDTMTATANGNYQIPIGQTKNFKLVITYQPASAISTRASLVNVNWNTADATTGFSTYTSGLGSNSFKTPYKAAN